MQIVELKYLAHLIEKELIRINFVLVEWDVEGSIWTIQNTGEPKKYLLIFQIMRLWT